MSAAGAEAELVNVSVCRRLPTWDNAASPAGEASRIARRHRVTARPVKIEPLGARPAVHAVTYRTDVANN